MSSETPRQIERGTITTRVLNRIEAGETLLKQVLSELSFWRLELQVPYLNRGSARGNDDMRMLTLELELALRDRSS